MRIGYQHLWLCLITWIYCTNTVCVGQETDVKNIRAYPIEILGDIELDGRLDDEIWISIIPDTQFTMQVPREGDAPSQKTEIRVAYDQQNLYLGIRLHDQNASSIKSYQRKRDASLETDDQFQFILDTYLDGRNAYYFAFNPSGAMRDGLLTTGQGSSLNLNWDGIWRAWTHIDAEGWTAEVRIPFRTLNFDPVKDSWGINFQRTIRTTNEELLWTGYRREQGLLRPQNAGILQGLTSISQGIGLEAIPYVTTRRRSLRTDDRLLSNVELDPGMDLNYNVASSLKASVTVNTDFAEAEVDSRQVNLTRFPLFFPEKRDFFLEGSNIYSFAPASGVRPYFSRRIGLSQGQTIPITVGARLLGRVGQHDVAIQHVKTGSNEVAPAEDFSVVRIKRNISRESRIGMVYTRRSTENGENLLYPLKDRHTMGVDIELNTSRFLGNKNLQFQAFFVYHNKESPLETSDFFDRTTRGLRINFPNRPWFGHASYREFGTDFQPALGFHPRVGFRRFQPSLGYNPLLENSDFIRDLEFGLRYEHLMDMDWKLLTQQIRFDLIEINLESADRFSFSVNRQFERLEDPFNILRDGTVILPTGDYTTWSIGGEIASASYRPISARIDLEWGEFWSGHKTEIGTALSIRTRQGLQITTTYVHTSLSFDDDRFGTDLFRLNVSYDFSPFISFASFIQWDNVSDQLGINNRFQWILSPGNDLFIVYNHNWQNQFDRFVTLNSTATSKISYTHRF